MHVVVGLCYGSPYHCRLIPKPTTKNANIYAPYCAKLIFSSIDFVLFFFTLYWSIGIEKYVTRTIRTAHIQKSKRISHMIQSCYIHMS